MCTTPVNMGDSCGKNCPFHGQLRHQKRQYHGKVMRKFAQNSVDIFRRKTKYSKKYGMIYSKRGLSTSVKAYLPPCIKCDIGQLVKYANCRPLSRTKTAVVVAVLNQKNG